MSLQASTDTFACKYDVLLLRVLVDNALSPLDYTSQDSNTKF